MNLPSDPDMRQLEIFRAISDGADTFAEIFKRSSYEHISSLRRLCSQLVRAGYLETSMRIKPRVQRNFSQWGHGPRATHFQISTHGEERLAELEREYASRDVGIAAS